jgi:ubiquitin-protein ligase
MAIVQVNSNVKFNYGADKTIIVVHNKEAIRVKYLIYFDMTEAKNAHNFINYFFNFMTTKINDIKKKNDLVKSDTIFNKICLKRLTAEIKQVQKADQIYGYPVKITYDEANIHIWKVEIESPKERWGKMTWEIRFNNDFPVQPPFVRIVTPAFKYQTGHITVGGAFCNPILTNQKWRSSVSILALLETLLVNMEEGGAQLDTVQKGPYNYQEALAAYNRYKTAHGW